MISSLAASAGILVLGVATGALLARLLGPTGRGELAAVILWPMILLRVGTLGINEGVVYEAANRTYPLAALASTSVVLAMIQSTALVALGFLVVPVALSQHEPAVIRDCLIFLTVIPLGMLNSYFASLLNGAHRYAAFNLVRLLVVATAAVLIVAFALLGELTVSTAVFAYLAGQLLTLTISLMAVLRLVEGQAAASLDLAKRLLTFGWRSQLSTLSSTLNERVDQLVISVVLPAQSLGLYVVAWTISSVVTWIGWSIAFVAMPAVARGRSDGERVLAARRYVRMTLAGSLLVALPLIAVAPILTEVVFGPGFAGSVDLTRILLLATVMLATARVLEAVLKGANRPLDASYAEAVGLVITACGLAILLPTLGLIGAAIASLAAYTASATVALQRANRALGGRGLGLVG